MDKNVSQNIQQLVTILFTELESESIIKLKNNEEFMNCINRLKNSNNNKIPNEEIEKLNPKVYEKHRKKDSVLDRYREI